MKEMKTVLKLPLYVEVETDNIDRKRVTDSIRSILYPQILSYLAKASFRKNVLEKVRTDLSVNNLNVKLLTELELFTQR